MRIGIDVRYLSHRLMGGIHTYLLHLVPAMIALAPEDAFVLYADRKQPFELTGLPANATVRYLPWRTPLDSIGNDLRFARYIAHDNLDVMHFPANYGVAPRSMATVITLHDAINIFPLWEATYRDWKRPRTIARTCYLQALTRYSLRHATMLMTVSEYAKQEIRRYRPDAPWEIVPVPHAPAPRFLRVPDEATQVAVRRRLDLPARYVLADALKNPAVLVRAWDRLPRPLRDATRIVFFSRTPAVRAEVQTAVEQGIAQLLIRPSENDLASLYHMAAAFVFPSWIEGFGLPVLEAMAADTPVISSDRHAIPEVAGGAALLMDAEDDAMLAAHLERVLTSPDEANRLRARGRARAATFNWSRSASMALAAYRVAAQVRTTMAAGTADATREPATR
jgi:glycosyltransferase involved in cell wall biosynthesis